MTSSKTSLYFSLAPLIMSISAGRLNRNNFNFTLEVKHTGAGIDNTALTLTDIEFRERRSDTTFRSHVGDIVLIKGLDNIWHGILFNNEVVDIESTIEFRLQVLNNLGLGITTTAYSVYGIIMTIVFILAHQSAETIPLTL